MASPDYQDGGGKTLLRLINYAAQKYAQVRAVIPYNSSEQELLTAANPAHASIASFAVPTGDPAVGQVKIAVTGTAVQLSATSKALPGGSVLVGALSTNSAAGTVGGSAINNTIDGTGNAAIIEAGDMVMVVADNITDVYVNGTADDVFWYTAG